MQGRVFTALRAELLQVVAAQQERKPRSIYPRRELRLDVLRVDLLNVSSIDEIRQTFHARLYVQCAFRGGARDAALSSASADFPVDEHGTPTYRPSARWFLDQIEFHNAVQDIDKLDYRVTTIGDDVLLNIRLHGEFFEVLELHRFPFDSQQLTFVMACKCATAGPCPLHFHIAPDAVRDVAGTRFALTNSWRLADELLLEATTVCSTRTRVFPALRISASITRRPTFYLVNVALPASFLSLMALLNFCIPQEAIGERLGYSSTLALTIVSAKFAASSSMPAIAYLTLIDRFQLACIGIIFLVVAEAGVFALLSPHAAAQAESVLMHTSIMMWLLVHFNFAAKSWAAWRQTRPKNRVDAT